MPLGEVPPPNIAPYSGTTPTGTADTMSRSLTPVTSGYNSPFSGQLAGAWSGQIRPLSQTSPLIQYLNSQQSLLGQQSTLAQNSLLNQIQNAQALYGINVGEQTNQHRLNTLALNNEQYRNVDLQRQALAGTQRSQAANYAAYIGDLLRQLGLADETYGLARTSANNELGLAGRAYDAAYGQYGRDWNIAGRDFTGTAEYNNQLRGFASEDFARARDTNQLAFDASRRATQSDATARGSMLSAGFRDTNLELARQLGLADRGAQSQYDQTYAGIGERDRNNQLQLDSRLSGLTANKDAADIAYSRAGIGAQESLDKADIAYRTAEGDIDYRRGQAGREFGDQQRDIKNQAAMLDSLAQDYGIKREQMASALQSGIRAMGIDLNDTMQKLTAMYQSDDAQRRAEANAITQQLLMAAQQATPPKFGTSTPYNPVLPSRSDPERSTAFEDNMRQTGGVQYNGNGTYSVPGTTLSNGEILAPRTVSAREIY